MSPGGVFVAYEEVNIVTLYLGEHIVAERCAGYRAVVPALGLKIGRDLRCLEEAAGSTWA